MVLLKNKTKCKKMARYGAKSNPATSI